MTERKKSAKERASLRYARVNKNLDKRLAQQEKMQEILSEEQYAKWRKTQNKRAIKNSRIKNNKI